MFLLDTNILSAMMATLRVAEVAAWMARHPPEHLFTAALCEAEILAGVAILPEGKRRTALQAAARAMFEEDFAGRVWAFDSSAALAYADLFAIRRRSGRPVATLDLMIASIARSHSATVVTRNVSDFAAFGVPVTNPWVDS